ncbi:MAG: HesA/MoeB/ThiF family protein [Candidatus Cloacimonetes bacterium]|nr:HesA/MoeB/ThiF family protein [Candidatus Cloacimonadota bacterium]
MPRRGEDLDWSRFQRQMILPEVGLAGQVRLKQSRVFICGMGALGNPALMYLAASGIGQISICDKDTVELSNLHRQILFDEKSLGKHKVHEAIKRLPQNETQIKAVPEALSCDNALELLSSHDLVLDCTDSFSARYAINDACVKLGIPMVSAAIHRFSGQISVFNFGNGPCYRCIFPNPPPENLVVNCATAGVMGFVPGLFGLWQVQEAIKILLGKGEILYGRILFYDALNSSVHYLNHKKNPACICANHTRVHFDEGDLIEEIEAATLLNGLYSEFEWLDVREPFELMGMSHGYGGIHIPLEELSQRLSEVDKDKSWLVVCKIGERSRTACEILRSAGFLRVKNLSGGLWSLVREKRRKSLDEN